MGEPFQSFIADALRRITEQLNSPAAIEAEEAEQVSARGCVLDVSAAERIDGGSLIFPDPGGPGIDWCVLELASEGPSPNPERGYLCGRVRAEVTHAEFVDGAYQLLLVRQADEEGRQVYANLLDQEQLSRRQVLKILAESTECVERGTRYLIAPDPSPWLLQAGVSPNDDPAFPEIMIAGSPGA